MSNIYIGTQQGGLNREEAADHIIEAPLYIVVIRS